MPVTTRDIAELIDAERLTDAARQLAAMAPQEAASVLDGLDTRRGTIAFRLLPKDDAVHVFDDMSSNTQARLIESLGTSEVVDAFDNLDPDDRAELLDELPATVAKRLIRTLSDVEREATSVVLGFGKNSVGRRMSPEFVHVYRDDTVAQGMARVIERGHDAETIYTIPVVDHERRLHGVVSLRDLLLGDPEASVEEYRRTPVYTHATTSAELAAHRCVDLSLPAMPVVDNEDRLIGMLTLDDAADVVAAARDEDAARAGAHEMLKTPYLQSSVFTITRARVVWLFVLAISAILTVNVLEVFEGTLEQKVALALFIPLLTGIGGNTGSQAATTVTRALAMDEVRARDVLRVAGKEARVGVMMGAALGVVGFAVASVVYDTAIGTVIGATIVSICVVAATVGGMMPLVAKMVRVDPAVFSTPFISTFCDATGLLIYFTIAKTVLGI
ncbi:magnesium transporter [Gordonia sp. HY285]|uniref:magnesium transporter n=1 Tax=Gordonia liuliyuniae TaxID=2911517 RepID=UPI001EFF6A9C|nr:magnesium transporter [Gordonia liuliyuniae]MCF8611493.1 magnesium transporter [Gordonia liuliyuniae]